MLFGCFFFFLEEEIKVGDEWITYQEIEIDDDDLKERVDHFWHKMFNTPDKCGDFFQVIPKMVKSALALCHSNADVERSLSTNKRMLTKNNTLLKPETLRGLRAIKCAIYEFGGVTQIPITLDMINAADKSHSIYSQYLREEELKKKEEEMELKDTEDKKRKAEEKKNEEEKMRVKLNELKEEEKKINQDIANAMTCIKEARNNIKDGRINKNMISVEAAERSLDVGIEKEHEGREKMKELLQERQKIGNMLLEPKKIKKQKIDHK